MEIKQLKQLYNDDTFTTDECFFETTNTKAIDFSTKKVKFDEPIQTKDDRCVMEQSCYFDQEAQTFKYVHIRQTFAKESSSQVLQVFDQENGKCIYKTNLISHSDVHENGRSYIFANNGMFFIKTFEDKFQICKFDFGSKEESTIQEVEVPAKDDQRLKLKQVFFIKLAHEVA